MSIVVLHEYGARNHYVGLEAFCLQHGIGLTYREFSIIRQLGKGILRRDQAHFVRGLRNAAFILSTALFGSGKTKYVVGIAPYDWRVIFVFLLLRKSDYYLHTSWPFWSGAYTPKRPLKLFDGIWRKFVYKSKGIFSVTKAVKENFCMTFDYPSEKVSVVYHGLTEEFFYKNRAERLKKKNSIIYVGRYAAEKGIDLLNKLSEIMPDYHFTFVGYGEKVPIIRKNVTDFGQITDKTRLIEIMESNEILLLPSRQSSSWQEVFGIVVIEALACGVFPIVAGQIGPREIVSESIGDILEADDFSDLEEIIRKFGRLSPKKKRAIAEEAKEHAKKYRAVDLAENWSLLGAN